MTRSANSRPLSRSVSLLLVMLLVTAFLPHRERALLLTDTGLDSVLAGATLEGSRFASPVSFDNLWGDRFGLWSANEPTALRRARNAPGRPAYAQLLPTALPLGSAAQSPGFVPPSGSIPEAPPVLASSGPGPGVTPSGPGGSIGSFPGGGGGGGGGGTITSPSPPFDQSPPVGVVPEPATWAIMIFGFGLIGNAMRRRNRQRQTFKFV